MSAAIEEAMKFTEDKTLEKREAVVTCWLNTKGIQVDYILEILFTVREESARDRTKLGK